MPQTTLPLSIIVPVSIQISALAANTPTFNIGLIIGNSGVIPSVGANSRLRLYNVGNWSTAMISDGFTINSPEYIAMGLYFAATPAPQYGYVGCQDPSAIATLQPTAGQLGTGYAVGNIITVVQAGAQSAQAKVTTIGANGTVTGLALISGSYGTGYSVAGALGTTNNGAGTGLKVDILTIGESAAYAVQVCRSTASDWYGCTVIGAAKADHIAIAAYVQTATPQTVYHYQTSDAEVLAGTAGNVFLALKALARSRAMGVYSTTQANSVPNNIYAGAATLGVAMGLNTGLSGSYFTMKFKNLPGIATEPLSVSDIATIEGANGNVYVNYSNSYNVFEQGVMGNGQYYDEVINIDRLGSNIQNFVMEEFVDSPAVSMTNAGEQQLIAAVSRACGVSADIGFIQTGVWSGPTVLDLVPGKALPLGYLAQAESFVKILPADKAARRMMPIYVGIIEGQAGHSVIIGVYIQR